MRTHRKRGRTGESVGSSGASFEGLSVIEEIDLQCQRAACRSNELEVPGRGIPEEVGIYLGEQFVGAVRKALAAAVLGTEGQDDSGLATFELGLALDGAPQRVDCGTLALPSGIR